MRAQPCSTLHDPMNCSPPGSSVQGIIPARILEWVAISRVSSQPGDLKQVSCVGKQILYHLATWEAQRKSYKRQNHGILEFRANSNLGDNILPSFHFKKAGVRGGREAATKKPSHSRKTDLCKAVKIHWSLQTNQKRASFREDQSENDPFSSGEPRSWGEQLGLGFRLARHVCVQLWAEALGKSLFFEPLIMLRLVLTFQKLTFPTFCGSLWERNMTCHSLC